MDSKEAQAQIREWAETIGAKGTGGFVFAISSTGDNVASTSIMGDGDAMLKGIASALRSNDDVKELLTMALEIANKPCDCPVCRARRN